MDNYEILGIKKDSNLIEINKKYRELIEIYKATKYEETTKFLENEKKNSRNKYSLYKYFENAG